MKHDNDVSDMIGYLQVVSHLQFHERNKTVQTRFVYIVFVYIVFVYNALYISSLYISSFFFNFVKSENNYFIKEIKQVLHAFIAW